MQLLVAAALLYIVSFLLVFRITPFLAYRLKLRGLVGKDVNKLDGRKVPEMGGIAVLLGFLFSSLIVLFLHSHFGWLSELNLAELLAGLLTIFLIGFLGVLDDLIGWKQGIRQWQHALVPIVASLPLVALSVGSSYMTVPFFAIVNFGIWYSIIIVPIAITGASNASNMLAGLNGLETGLAIINSAAMFAISLLFGRIEAALLMAALLGGLCAFLYFNKYPAKIFPGDSLTLMAGAGIATAAIVGNLEKFALLLFALYFVELFLKSKKWFQAESFGIPQRDGTLKAPKEIDSLTHWAMSLGKFNEGQVVAVLWGLQAIIALAVFLYALVPLLV
ncbi:MAG: UDP-N-acetylglucosamine--dolichyl-phosphate N-acetylglucosaminephosphotransferase [Candidatus Diapherotrites archaeon]